MQPTSVSKTKTPPPPPPNVLRKFIPLFRFCSLIRPLSCNAETKDITRPTSHPVQGWAGKNKAFCSPGTQNGHQVIKVYFVMSTRSSVGRAPVDLFRRSWVQTPLGPNFLWSVGTPKFPLPG